MWGTLGALALLPALVRSYASTDSIMDADLAQSGYLSNHPMDPNVVGGSSFGVLWKQQMTDSKEQWFAKPLVYTQNGGSEMLITASNENNVRIHDAKTGTLIASRQLHPPFLQSDIGCADVPDYIGVMGTPIIDPATDIIYMYAKGYKNGAASGGVANGEYKLHALQLPALTNAPGFPVTVDGHRADNDPAKYLIGGTIMQRPALTSLNGVIVAAFGGHCDLFNYTGMIVSVSKTPNVGVVSIYAMEMAPGAPSPNPTDITSEKGGKAGIWQSGMGLATDGNRIFVTTGNGQGHANGDVPASGRLPLTTLDEVVANFAVSSTGVFSLTDYFEPYDYVQMDAQDKDLGSSGTALLDTTTFRTSTINRMAVTVGKNGKVYITNADNLGGFKQGAGGTDNIIQTITAGNSVFGGAGSYPLEGGYVYFTPVGLPTYAYKFGTDASGAPFFTQAGKTATNSAGRAGVGQPTVTSYNGIAGTGILWVTDVNSGLLAFKAVPNSAGVLEAITLPATPGINKYQRPVFGSGKVFVTASNKIYCLGYPVNLPLNCTTPVDFGSVQTGDTKTATISCKANIAITKVNGCVASDKLFQCSNSSMPQGALAAGATFTFPVTWNLTEKSIQDAEGTSYSKVLPGVESGVLSLITTNGVSGYTDTTPLSLTGTVVSADPYLWMNPSEVDFGGLVLGSDDASAGLTGSASIANIGSRALTFTGMAWQLGTDTTGAWHNLTFTDQGADFGLGFSSSSFPKPGSSLAAGETIAVPLLFNSSTIGTYSLNLMLWSDGGQDSILFAASVGNPPIATIAVSTLEGGWDYSEPTHMAFGNVLAGQTVIKKIQICNVGGSVLTITKSKPPSSAQLTAVSPYGELLEGQKIDVGACANGSVAVYAAPIQPNHPSQYISLVWVLNTDGLSNLDRTQPFGVHEVQTDVTIVSAQIGPLLANGTARYQWVGCFSDTNGRNLATQINTAAQQSTNSNDQCQTLCMNAGYAIAGTEYSKECWCGSTVKQPSSLTPDSANHCTFSCTGNTTQSCGGDGGYLSMYADITKFDIAAFLAGNSNSATTTATTKTATGTTTGTATGSTTVATSTSTGSALNPNEPAVVNSQWNYIGCYKDNVNNVRSLSTKSTAADTMTLESCATYCSAYNFFGTEYGRECYCGYTLDTTLRTTESDCSTKCAANSAELCGAGSRLSVYNNTVYNAPPPSPSHVARSGNYAWLGCYTEATTGRALATANYASDLMTVDACAAYCAGKGTQYMGVEYGRECYCGNALGVGVNLTSTSDCSTLCKNNTLQYCGAGSRLDLYTYSPQSSTSSSVISTSSVILSSSSSSSVVLSTASSLTSWSTISSGSLSTSSSVSGSSSSSVGSFTSTGLSTSSSSSSVAATSSSSSLQSTSSTDVPVVTSSTSSTQSSSSSLFSTITTSSSTDSTSSSIVSSSSSTSSPVPSSSSSTDSSSSSFSTVSSSFSSSSVASTSSSSSSSLSTVSSSSSSSSVASTSSSSSQSASSSLLSSSSSSSGPASTSATSTSNSRSSSSTSTGPTATATNGYYHLGCYQDTSSGHVLPQLFANDSVTPELCIAYAKSLYDSSPTPTTQMPYVYVEYHRECYGGSTMNFQGSAVTSLIGTKACTDYCSGSIRTFTTNGAVSVTTGKANMCGGAKQFNLYAMSTPIAFPTTGGPVTTKSA